jgi:endonuclease G
MKNLLIYINFVVCLFISFSALSNPIDDNCPQFVLRGAPVSSLKNTQYLCKKNYAIHYRYDTRTAEYVVEHITKESVTGPAKRADDFRADPSVDKQHQSLLSDYAGFPYDRGHLSPAGDNTQTEEIMSESFFLTNMVPQVPNHNRGIWKQLETYIRNWVLEGKDIYVVTGTAYSPGYETIGNNKVGIPQHMWKVIVDRKSGKAIAFLFPNMPLPVVDLPKYVTTIDEIELSTGINFMPKLPVSSKLEKEKANLNDWSGLH